MASEGCPSKWENRHVVKQLVNGIHKISADSDVALEYANNFIEIKGFTKDQIFNVDKTGRNYKMDHTESFAIKTETRARGYKKQGAY